MSSLLNIRVADIQTTYEMWSERGAYFLTPPNDACAPNLLPIEAEAR